VYCSTLQHDEACCSILQRVAACCSVLQRVAACCSVLQCVAYPNLTKRIMSQIQEVMALHCNMLQYTAVKMLPRVAA
jgi:hypothetical protein